MLPTPVLTSGLLHRRSDRRPGPAPARTRSTYNINAPVSVDGGSGFNRLVVLGTEFADHIVVTDQGVFGAGLEVTYRNIQVLEIDALQGDDTIDVLSTPANMIVRVLGGLGSDTINVAGDVVGEVVARDINGSSATINHLVTSTDPNYNNIVAPGINVDVAQPAQGNVIITETGGGTDVSRGGTCGLLLVGCVMDSYTVQLASAPTSDVWITVSAEMSPAGPGPASGHGVPVHAARRQPAAPTPPTSEACCSTAARPRCPTARSSCTSPRRTTPRPRPCGSPRPMTPPRRATS